MIERIVITIFWFMLALLSEQLANAFGYGGLMIAIMLMVFAVYMIARKLK